MIAGKRKQSDQWGTPNEVLIQAKNYALERCGPTVAYDVFGPNLDKPWGLDPCPGNHPVAGTVVFGNGLEAPWITSLEPTSIFVNPPFSDIHGWVMKAISESSLATSGGIKHVVCMIVPANRTESEWWQTYIEPFRDTPVNDGMNLSTVFLPKRTKFIPLEGQNVSSPSYACVLLYFWYNGA